MQRVHVSGNVSLDGKPLEQGDITFLPIEGASGPATGGAIRNGQYDVAAAGGPLAGRTYQVQINSLVDRGRIMPNPVNPQGPPVNLPDNTVPPKYNIQSVLKITFTADAKERRENFDLKSELVSFRKSG